MNYKKNLYNSIWYYKKELSMKKIFILLLLLTLSSCTWNYKNWDIQKNIEAEDVKEFEKELLELEQQKAKEALEKIKLENEIASEVLDNFLKSEDFDIKAEIERTKQKYNDNLGPILEYEHEKEEVVEEETNSWETFTWSTLSWAILENQEDIIETSQDNSVYSWEIKIEDTTIENKINSNNSQETKEDITQEEIKYNTQVKKWRSGTYTMYIGLSDNCKWWLEMSDLEWNKKWLFENTCEKMIYNFELAVWGINISYNTQDAEQKTEFVSIK